MAQATIKTDRENQSANQHSARLSDVAEILSGGTPKTSKQEYWDGTIPWLSIADFNNGLRWVSDAEKKITDLALKESSTQLLKARDIILSARGTVGVLAQLTKPMAFNQSCYGIRGVKDVSDTDYLYYAVKNAVSELKRMAHGAVFDTITRSTFDEISITLPEIREQQTIASILGSLDDKIELNRQMSETLEQMAQALFKLWFVDFDPVRAKAEGRDTGLPKEIADLFPDSFVDSEIGEIPKGWEVKSLDEIATFLNGLALQKYPATGEDDLPVIKIAQLRAGNTSGADRANTDISKEYVIHDGDILFSWSGSLEVEVWTGGKGALNQHLFKVDSTEYPKWFYFYWTRHHLKDFRAIAAGKATTMGHIQRHHLHDAKVLVPGEKIMAAMETVIAPLLMAQIALRVEAKTLGVIRDTLLPELLAGRTKVN